MQRVLGIDYINYQISKSIDAGQAKGKDLLPEQQHAGQVAVHLQPTDPAAVCPKAALQAQRDQQSQGQIVLEGKAEHQKE